MVNFEEQPIGMIAQHLQRAFETECFRRLEAAGFTGLRMRHSILLTALAPGGSRITTLAAELGMTKQAMGQMVDELESADYLERTDDPADRRARVIRLTRRGSDALETAATLIPTIEREYADLIGEARYRELKQAMAELALAASAP